jgi:hypothetical protein
MVLGVPFGSSQRIVSRSESRFDMVSLATDKGISVANLVQEMNDAFIVVRSRFPGFTIKILASFFEQHLDHHGISSLFEKLC